MASARQRDTLIGMGRVISDGVLHAFVTEMIVHESMRGLGVGAELLRRIVERTVGRGITDTQLFAAAGRQRFYERNGFVARPGNAPGMQLVQLPRAPPCRDRPTRPRPPVTGSSSQHPNGC